MFWFRIYVVTVAFVCSRRRVSASSTIPLKYMPTCLRDSVQVELTPGLGLSRGLQLALGSASIIQVLCYANLPRNGACAHAHVLIEHVTITCRKSTCVNLVTPIPE